MNPNIKNTIQELFTKLKSTSANPSATTAQNPTLGTPAAQQYLAGQQPRREETAPGSGNYGTPGDGQSNPSSSSAVGISGTTQSTTSDPYQKYITMLQGPEAKSYLDASTAAKSRLADIQSEEDTKSLAARREYERLLNASGGTTAGAQASATQAGRRSNSELADLATREGAAARSAGVASDAYKDFTGNIKDVYGIEKDKIAANPSFDLSPGAARYTYNSATGRYEQSANLPAKPPSLSEQYGSGSIGEYNFAKSEGYKGSFTDYQNEDANRKARAVSASQDSNRILSATEAQALGVPFGTTAGQAYGRTPEKPLTESQAKDLTYATRSDEANSTLNGLEKTISSMNPLNFSTQTQLESSDVTSPLVSDTIRQVRQAERNFATAALRRESGAAISASEFTTLEKQYFPRPGDDAKTLAQKAQNRQTAINSFKQGAGSSYEGRVGTGGNNGQSSGVKITGLTALFPNGGSLTFPDQATLNQFKKDQGL